MDSVCVRVYLICMRTAVMQQVERDHVLVAQVIT